MAYVDHDDVVTVVSPSQNITHHRHMLARIIAKPISKVRFIMSPVGGGFGSWTGNSSTFLIPIWSSLKRGSGRANMDSVLN